MPYKCNIRTNLHHVNVKMLHLCFVNKLSWCLSNLHIEDNDFNNLSNLKDES